MITVIILLIITVLSLVVLARYSKSARMLYTAALIALASFAIGLALYNPHVTIQKKHVAVKDSS